MASAVGYFAGLAVTEPLVGRERARQLALLPGIIGLTPIGLVVPLMVARREQEAAPAPSTTLPPALPTVPDVRLMPFTDASKAVTTAGFTVTRQNQPSDVVAKDYVFDQQPAAGTATPAGSTVTLIVSSGPSAAPTSGTRG